MVEFGADLELIMAGKGERIKGATTPSVAGARRLVLTVLIAAVMTLAAVAVAHFVKQSNASESETKSAKAVAKIEACKGSVDRARRRLDMAVRLNQGTSEAAKILLSSLASLQKAYSDAGDWVSSLKTVEQQLGCSSYLGTDSALKSELVLEGHHARLELWRRERDPQKKEALRKLCEADLALAGKVMPADIALLDRYKYLSTCTVWAAETEDIERAKATADQIIALLENKPASLWTFAGEGTRWEVDYPSGLADNLTSIAARTSSGINCLTLLQISAALGQLIYQADRATGHRCLDKARAVFASRFTTAPTEPGALQAYNQLKMALTRTGQESEQEKAKDGSSDPKRTMLHFVAK